MNLKESNLIAFSTGRGGKPSILHPGGLVDVPGLGYRLASYGLPKIRRKTCPPQFSRVSEL